MKNNKSTGFLIFTLSRKVWGSYHEIDYDLNRQLIEIATVHEASFVYLSSMGVEWAKWNSYMKARFLVERDLQNSKLSYAIIRPGILSGKSRDQDRPTEELGAWFSHKMAHVYQTLGLQKTADGTRPLDAPEIAMFVGYILEQVMELQHDIKKGKIQNQYELADIHKILRQQFSTL